MVDQSDTQQQRAIKKLQRVNNNLRHLYQENEIANYPAQQEILNAAQQQVAQGNTQLIRLINRESDQTRLLLLISQLQENQADTASLAKSLPKAPTHIPTPTKTADQVRAADLARQLPSTPTHTPTAMRKKPVDINAKGIAIGKLVHLTEKLNQAYELGKASNYVYQHIRNHLQYCSMQIVMEGKNRDNMIAVAKSSNNLKTFMDKLKPYSHEIRMHRPSHDTLPLPPQKLTRPTIARSKEKPGYLQNNTSSNKKVPHWTQLKRERLQGQRQQKLQQLNQKVKQVGQKFRLFQNQDSSKAINNSLKSSRRNIFR